MRKPTQLKTSHLAKYSAIAALSLTLAACGGGGSNNDTNTPTPKPNPGPGQTTISSIGFNQALLTSSANPSEAKTLVTIDAQSIKVNNAAATAEQFKNLTLSLDGANKDLFTLDKTDTSATLRFNKDANKIAKNTCTDNVCKAIVKAVLSSKQAQLNANVSITYPVINSIGLTQVGEVSVVSNESKQLASFNKDDFKVNGQASTAEQFKAATFSLTGANASLFTLDKTDTSLTLTFNKDASEIAKNTCTSNVCTASITATLEDKTANVESRVKLLFPVKVKISDIALPTSRYFIMPGRSYCLVPRLINPRPLPNYQSYFEYDKKCLDTVKDEKVAIPLTLLLVRDEGQTCIVKKADGSCDTSVTSSNATTAQREAYIQKYALTADELEGLQVSIKGYADNIGGSPVNKPDCQDLMYDKQISIINGVRIEKIIGQDANKKSVPYNDCKLFVNKPNNPAKDKFKSEEGNYNYDINGRFGIEYTTTNYFSDDGVLGNSVSYHNDYLSKYKQFLKGLFGPGGRKENPARHTQFLSRLADHAYQAQQSLFKTRYQNAKQPMLVLNNNYPKQAAPERFINDSQRNLTQPWFGGFGGAQDDFDRSVGHSNQNIQAGLIEGDRVVNTLYPLALEIKGKNTLALNVGIWAVDQDFEVKYKQPYTALKPIFLIEKDKNANPVNIKDFGCNGKGAELRKLRGDLKNYGTDETSKGGENLRCSYKTEALRKNTKMQMSERSALHTYKTFVIPEKHARSY